MRLRHLAAAALLAAATVFPAAADSAVTKAPDALPAHPPKTFTADAAKQLAPLVKANASMVDQACDWRCWNAATQCTANGGDTYTCDSAYQSCKAYCPD